MCASDRVGVLFAARDKASLGLELGGSNSGTTLTSAAAAYACVLLLCGLLLAGVDEVLDGSVIAVSYVDYSKDAPLEAVDAAIEHMQDSAQTQYADSKLPAKWGWLLNYSIGQNKTALLEENPADVSIQALNFPAQSGEQARRKLSVTATIAVTITGLIVLLGVALLIYSFRNRRAASKQDLDAAGAKKAAKVEKAKLGGKKTSAVGTQGGGGGSGGTGGRSGYLHDLDGMLDDGSSAQDTKTISSGVSVTMRSKSKKMLGAGRLSRTRTT